MLCCSCPPPFSRGCCLPELMAAVERGEAALGRLRKLVAARQMAQAAQEATECPVCTERPKEMVLGCGRHGAVASATPCTRSAPHGREVPPAAPLGLQLAPPYHRVAAGWRLHPCLPQRAKHALPAACEPWPPVTENLATLAPLARRPPPVRRLRGACWGVPCVPPANPVQDAGLLVGYRTARKGGFSRRTRRGLPPH